MDKTQHEMNVLKRRIGKLQTENVKIHSQSRFLLVNMRRIKVQAEKTIDEYERYYLQDKQDKDDE